MDGGRRQNGGFDNGERPDGTPPNIEQGDRPAGGETPPDGQFEQSESMADGIAAEKNP